MNPASTIFLILPAVCAITLFGGCSWQVGSGPKNVTMQPTLGQQLIDLQRARDSGIINESQYQSQKTRLLGHK